MEPSQVQVFSDFDGTITTRDTIVFLTEKHGRGPQFRNQMLNEIKTGRMTVFEVIERELETVTLSWPEARESLLRNIEIDPSFAPFVKWSRSVRLPLSVVSSGLEPTVRVFVGDYGLPIHAHPVECALEGWRYRVRESSLKSVVLSLAKKEGKVVYIGDGTSDVDAIPFADVLFAKSYLGEYCRRNNVPYEPFQTFSDVHERLQAYLEKWRG